MITDPIVSWLIALAVCTLYGWVMYSRGAKRGAYNAAWLIVTALSERNVISAERIDKEVAKYIEEQNRPLNDEEP